MQSSCFGMQCFSPNVEELPRLRWHYGCRSSMESGSTSIGGLISYGINLPKKLRRSADYVVKILKGANPGDLPVEFPTRLELIINLKAASMIGINHPTNAHRPRRR